MAKAPHRARRGMGIEETTRLRVAVARLARLLRPTAAAGSLTTTEVEVLATAARRGPIKLSELAGLAGLNPTMLSRVVARLESLDLLARLYDESDRRVCRVKITPKGDILHELVRTERTEVLCELVGHLSEGEVAALQAAVPVLEELAEMLLGGAEGGTGDPAPGATPGPTSGRRLERVP